MTFDLGSIRAILDLDDSGYTKGILNAQGLNKIFGESFATFITNPVLGGISVLQDLAGAAIGMGQEVLANAEHVQRLGLETGISAEAIQGLRAEYEIAGRAVEQSDQSLRAFIIRLGQARQGAGDAALAFATLGSDILKLDDNDEALRTVLARLVAIEDQAERNALAAKLFGEEAGPKLLQTIGGNLDQIIEKRRKLGQVFSQEDIDLLAGFNTTLGTTGQLMDGVARSAIVNFLAGLIGQVGTADEELEDLAENINTKLGPAMRDVGSDVGSVIGDLGELVDKLNEIVDLIDGPLQNFRGLFRDNRDGFDALTDFDTTLRPLDYFNEVGYGFGITEGSRPPRLSAFTPREVVSDTDADLSGTALFRLLRFLGISGGDRREVVE